ncbi:MAG: hypothetical protein GY699_07510 [Desulfobacteraceae bacterium]|nr:hypothetical protein [Desulfobacteraceae bacterium]
MKNFIRPLFIIILIIFLQTLLFADDFDFNRMESSFKNFITCELTRTNATNHFNGKPFRITMIDLFDIQNESDLKIITGAIECSVVGKQITLYTAVGLKSILNKEQVVYYTIRNKDFSILATELLKFPYKERCKWSQFWIDID